MLISSLSWPAGAEYYNYWDFLNEHLAAIDVIVTSFSGFYCNGQNIPMILLYVLTGTWYLNVMLNNIRF